MNTNYTTNIQFQSVVNITWIKYDISLTQIYIPPPPPHHISFTSRHSALAYYFYQQKSPPHHIFFYQQTTPQACWSICWLTAPGVPQKSCLIFVYIFLMNFWTNRAHALNFWSIFTVKTSKWPLWSVEKGYQTIFQEYFIFDFIKNYLWSESDDLQSSDCFTLFFLHRWTNRAHALNKWLIFMVKTSKWPLSCVKKGYQTIFQEYFIFDFIKNYLWIRKWRFTELWFFTHFFLHRWTNRAHALNK